MEGLPDQLLWEIFDRIKKPQDRNSFSSVCKRFYRLDNEQRRSLHVGCGLNPANEALTSLCIRFPNLTKIDVIYSGWMSNLGKQLDDQGLLVLSNNCPSLTTLTLKYCTFITDTGLSHLAFCSNLLSLELNFTPRITGCGILSLVMGCKNLRFLHLIQCINIGGGEWLEYLGKLEILEDLLIQNCRSFGEVDLMKLGPGWRKLKKLHFELDSGYRYRKDNNVFAVHGWQKHCVPCENMKELSLINCIVVPGKGLACVLGECKNLEKLHLGMCVGARDCDILGLAKNWVNLRSISLRFQSVLSLPSSLTDEILNALAQICSRLESVKLSFSNGEFQSYSPFTLDGILCPIRMCPIQELALENVCLFNDVGMSALCLVEHLHTLEVVRCQGITNEGLKLVGQFPRLRILKISKCLGITDEGLKPLVGLCKLEVLAVEDCPLISAMGIQGVAKSVTFKQDLSWMH